MIILRRKFDLQFNRGVLVNNGSDGGGGGVLSSEYLGFDERKESGVSRVGTAQFSGKNTKFSMGNRHGVSSTRCLLEEPSVVSKLGTGRARIGSGNFE